MIIAPVFAFLLSIHPLQISEPFSFFPNTGSPGGGETIRITAQLPSLDFRVAPPIVRFGGVASPQVTVIDSKTLTAVTPPHAEGAVDVQVSVGGVVYGTFFKFGYVRPREALLIPVAIDIPGAFGSRWTTDIWVFNDSDDAVNLFPEVCISIGEAFPCGEKMLVPAHGTLQLPIAARRSAESPGMYLAPPTDVMSRLHFSIRVHNAATPDDLGFEVPVARRTDFRRGKVEMLNVPVSDRFRSLIRIYDEMQSPQGGVTVRAYDMQSGALLAQRRMQQFLPSDTPLRLTFIVHDFLGTPEIRGHNAVRLEIQEDDADASLWAMLTLTENATQRVTVLTSQ